MKKIADIITRFVDLFYIGPIRKYIPIQTFRYGMCGGANMLLDLILYFVIFHFVVRKQFLDLGFVVISPHILSLLIVFPITFFNGFWLNKHVTFKYSPLKGSTQLLRYGLSVAGSLLLNYVCMKLLVETLHIYPSPSKAVTTAITTVYSYLMQKHFTFRGNRTE